MRAWRDLSESFRVAVKVNVLIGVACIAGAFWLTWLEGNAAGTWYEGLPEVLTTVVLGDGVLCLGLAIFMLIAKKTGSNMLFVLFFYGRTVRVPLSWSFRRLPFCRTAFGSTSC